MAKILIVEDDSYLLNIYSTIFEKEGFEVLTAITGEEALALIRKSRPNMVLLDIMLPGRLNGLDVLREKSAVKELKNIPVMILSSLEDDKMISEGLKLGALGYFIKSQLNPDDVVRNVKTFVK
jgi:DNA-binding response OmpR family regulator